MFYLGILWGDPHMITTDGFDYSCNPIGEFWMIKTLDNSFGLQARTCQMTGADGTLYQGSTFCAFSAQEMGTPKVEVELNPSKIGKFLIFSPSLP